MNNKIVNLSLFLMFLNLEKDLFPEQLVTIKLRNSLILLPY